MYHINTYDNLNESRKILMDIKPKSIGITAKALMGMLSADNSKQKIENLCNKLHVDHLFVFWPALKPFMSEENAMTSSVISLFENDTLIFISDPPIKEEAQALQMYLDTHYPDNWGMIVYSVDEYIDFRLHLGKEDLYGLGGDNFYVG